MRVLNKLCLNAKKCSFTVILLNFFRFLRTSAVTVRTRGLRPVGKPNIGSKVGSEFCLGVTRGPSLSSRIQTLPILGESEKWLPLYSSCIFNCCSQFCRVLIELESPVFLSLRACVAPCHSVSWT